MRKIPQLNRGGGPGRGRGRVQRSARRAFYGGEIVSTADVVQMAFATSWPTCRAARLPLGARRIGVDSYAGRPHPRPLAAMAIEQGLKNGYGPAYIEIID